MAKLIDHKDMDQLLTKMENLCYACEAKSKMPSLTYRHGVNAQIERALAFCKRLQKKYNFRGSMSE